MLVGPTPTRSRSRVRARSGRRRSSLGCGCTDCQDQSEHQLQTKLQLSHRFPCGADSSEVGAQQCRIRIIPDRPIREIERLEPDCSVLLPVSLKFLMAEKSHENAPGPVTVFLPASPKVPNG